MKIFLAGSFQNKEGEDKLRDVYDFLLEHGYDVWWAPMHVSRGYEMQDENSMRKIIETEEKTIEKCDVFVVALSRATFGTSMEIKHAFDNKIPIIAFLFNDSPDFKSAAFRYRVRNIVKNKEELVALLDKFKH